MKKITAGLVSGLFLLQSVSFAQTSAVVPVIGGNKGGVFVGSAGKYDINQITQDNTRVALDVINQIKDIQKIDRDYLMSIAERLNGHLQNLTSLRLNFTKLSQDSKAKEFINLESYLNLVNEINNKDQILKNEIQTQTLITRESLPSYSSIEAGGQKATIGTIGNINMGALTSRVEALRTQLISEMNSLEFPNMKSRLGQPISVNSNALNPSLKGIRILTEAEIQEKTNLIQEKLTLAANTQKLANRFVDITVTMAINFISDYGTEEWLRWRNDNDVEARGLALSQINDSFMRRSYLRRKYGVRLGAIQAQDYDKKLANLEDFGYQPLAHALKSMRREAAATQPDVLKAFENARNWVELYDKKLTPVFQAKNKILSTSEKQKEFSSKNTGVLVRANAAINTLTGQKAAAEALLFIMRLVLADAREEMMLYENSVNELTNYHNSRFRIGEDMKTAYNSKICQIDFYLNDAVVAAVCGGKKAKIPLMTGGRSIQESFNGLLFQIETVEKSKRQEAEFAQQLIDAAIKAGQIQLSEEQKKVQDQEALDMFR